MRQNINAGVSKLTPVALLAFFNNVIAKFIGNPLFTAPPFSVAMMQTFSTALQAAIAAATNGSAADRQHRLKVVTEVKDVVRVTADYVRTECDGDGEKLASSGYPLTKIPTPINVVGIPKYVYASPTDVSGEIRIRYGKGEGSRMYRIERAEQDPTLGETTWVTVGLVARQSFTMKGLKPYVSYWFRVTAIGIDKEGLPSDVVLGRAA